MGEAATEQTEGEGPIGVIPPEVSRTVSGLEVMRGMIAGRYPRPPIAELVGFRPIAVDPGHVVFASMPEERHYNPFNSVHGGYAATILDSCMACAVVTKLEAGMGCTTLEFKISFARPITAATGSVRAEGTAISVGRRTALAEARLLDGEGRILATGSSTLLVFPIL